jgi:hypothetical protein
VSTYQNDGLHPDAAGYKVMGESIDLDLFADSLALGVNSIKAIGTHLQQWAAAGLANGVYFYRLRLSVGLFY